MSDCISRQAAIDALNKLKIYRPLDSDRYVISDCLNKIVNLPSAQPETHDKRTETHACDYISRQATIDEIEERKNANGYRNVAVISELNRLEGYIMRLPSAQPTLYGYDIEHLILIANALKKESLPPERVVEALTDIGRIVSIVKDEFEESLRKAVEQCKI